MKKNTIISVMVLVFATCGSLPAQNQQDESLGLPGDNLNLYAVMKLFQESETLEGFERTLNDENSRINNLDLNGDGYVDYIRVIDNVDRNVHYIVLQDAISSRENQDVAVFTVMREADGQVQLQLIGDEALYGRDYIIEPIYDETPNPGYTGNKQRYAGQPVVVTRTTTYEIAAWPLVRFIFLPTYVVWHSPWYYSYYPSYWHPWNSFYWDYYYGYHYNDYHYYYSHYRHWDHYRNPYWRDSYYSSRRSYSPIVHNRIQGGSYKTTYSHPEQRREGTAMYRRTNPDQNKRSTGKSTESSSMRRSTSQSGTSRQSTTSGTNRSVTPTESNRRSTSAGADKKSTTTGTSRSSTSTPSNRASTSTRSDRKATTTQTNRRSNAPAASQPSTTTGTRTSKQSSATNNSGRRSSSSSKSGTSGKSTKKSKETTTKKPGRR